jgi:hypothetical protein
MTAAADESGQPSHLLGRSAFDMNRCKTLPAAAGAVIGSRGPQRKKLEQRRNAGLLEANDNGLECGAIRYFPDRGAIPTAAILEDTPVHGQYERGTQPGIEHEGVVLSQEWVAQTIWLRLPQRKQDVLRQIEQHRSF